MNLSFSNVVVFRRSATNAFPLKKKLLLPLWKYTSLEALELLKQKRIGVQCKAFTLRSHQLKYESSGYQKGSKVQ